MVMERFKRKLPHIVTVDEIEKNLTAHRYAGSQLTPAGRIYICYCGKHIPDQETGLIRHEAEEIEKLLTKGQ